MFAMKELLKKNPVEEAYIRKEIELHLKLNHSNIIKMEDYFETDDKVYIFMEYASKGDLFDFVRKHDPSDFTLLKFYH